MNNEKNITKDLKLVYLENECKVYEFTPSFFKLFYINLEPLSIRKWIRFQGERTRGYKVYYMTIHNDVVGSCLVSKGGGRYFFANHDDVVVGPYFICEKHRKKGYASKLVDIVINKLGINYRYAWDWIEKNNIGSIMCTEKNGFERIYEVNVVGLLRRMEITEKGKGGWFVYKFHRK